MRRPSIPDRLTPEGVLASTHPDPDPDQTISSLSFIYVRNGTASV